METLKSPSKYGILMFRAKFIHRIMSWNVNKFLVKKKLKPQKSQNCDLQSEHILTFKIGLYTTILSIVFVDIDFFKNILGLKDTFSKLPCVEQKRIFARSEAWGLEQIFYGFSNFRATKSTDFLRGYTLWGMALKTRTMWSSG